MIHTYLLLIYEFFKVGLFSVGGGMATIPFLADMGERIGWFSYADLMNMLAVSESTPGPIGINMATYVGYIVAGIPGAVTATLSEVAPAVIIIFIISLILDKFRTNKYVDWAFYGLRAASVALIAAALIEVFLEVAVGGGQVNLKAIILMPIIWYFSAKFPRTKKWHPICFVLISAVIGMVFHFAS